MVDTQTTLARRDESAQSAAVRHEALSHAEESSISLSIGGGIDQDDYAYRRLTSGAKFQTRDLTPLSHDRQLEVAWYLFEGNPLARRLITLMTDLIVGEGVQIEVLADDKRIQAAVDAFVGRNRLGQRLREFYISNSVNGELIFPVGLNEITGVPVLGFIDSAQVKQIRPVQDNILFMDTMVLKSMGGIGDGETLKIIRENPVTGRLEGNVFYHRINALPNSLRGRSDLMPLADWLDLYDQFMFAEVERLNLLSSFAWDYKIEGATSDKEIQDKIKRLPRLKPGAVFGHNEKESLEPRTPDLKANDRSEVARMLRVHIVGTMGFPVSYFGDVDSNNATIQGQNDVMMKTPAARQKEFGGLLDLMVRFALEQQIGKNPALFRDAKPTYKITMPEIAAKDIARVGTVIASVMTGLDTGINNETMSKKLAIRVIAGLIKQLGIDADPVDIANEIEDEKEARNAAADLLQSEVARLAGNNRNTPPAEDPDDEDADGE
jgi:hypothetical protein